jgi:chitinase
MESVGVAVQHFAWLYSPLLDIDWEYPGGNGGDYKQVPNSQKAYQINAFPKMLAETRVAIGKKLLSIAVPGKKGEPLVLSRSDGS